MSAPASALYVGRVVHQRLRPRRHRLSYRVFSLLLDLDELPALARRLRLFRLGRSGWISFRSADHGDGGGGPLRPWVEAQLRAAGIAGGGAIRILCYPRVFGYVFNPLSVYFCHGPDGALAAILYEVNNTFGDRHCYLIPVAAPAAVAAESGANVEQSCAKSFYVSPFIPVAGRYQFKVRLPGEAASVVINHLDETGYLLHASFRGTRMALTDAAIARCLLTHPLMTLKVMAGIHWEAFRLWRKGIPVVRRPQPPAEPVTIVAAAPAPARGAA